MYLINKILELYVEVSVAGCRIVGRCYGSMVEVSMLHSVHLSKVNASK